MHTARTARRTASVACLRIAPLTCGFGRPAARNRKLSDAPGITVVSALADQKGAHPVSVTDDVPRLATAGVGPQRSVEFERTPPQDIAAEQCVLGGMLLSKDAIADAVSYTHLTLPTNREV